MDVYIVKDEREISKSAYELMLTIINEKDAVVLGLATGSSPEGIYEMFRENKPDVSHVTTVNLDEYIGLPAKHSQSYAYFMKNHLFNHLNFKKTYLPNGMVADYAAECARYDQILADNIPDLQLLGIGENGHIAFNEPGSAFDLATHISELKQETITVNKRFFESESDVPPKAITMGIKTIMKAKRILLIASGTPKAEAIKKMLEGDVSNEFPASILQTHSDVTVIIDQEAASLLTLDDKDACCGNDCN